MKSYVAQAGQFLLLAGFLILSYPLAIWAYGSAFQIYQNWQFDHTRQLARQEETVKSTSHPEADTVIGRMEIPRLNVSVMIVEGVGEKDLSLGAGHLPGSAFPGEIGNVVIGAHRDTFFRPLREIRANDVLAVTTSEASYRYVVTSTEVVGPKDTAVLLPGREPTLTLITCYPFSYVGPAPQRFVVRARQEIDLDSEDGSRKDARQPETETRE